jgi:hypothetical protein
MIQRSFKPGISPIEWNFIHPQVQAMFNYMQWIWNEAGFDLVITSMIRPAGTIKGESGVHATGRALDCVPRRRMDGFMRLDSDEMQDYCQLIESLVEYTFKRADGKRSCIYHNHRGGGWHFHLQWHAGAGWRDLQGVVPKAPEE